MTLLDLLRTPSAFEHDRWGFARNQIGHGYIVGGLGAMLIGWWILPLYFLWEVAQEMFYNAQPWDNFEDFANVLVVCLAVMTANPWFLAVHVVYLVSGWLRR